ncbi:PIN-like domain-containing protein, partial [Spirosoma migulaei]
MDIKSIDIYQISSAREEAFFKECIFIFDTSSLLDFYIYPNKTKETIFKEVFNVIQNRLWITSHTEYEYLHNRKTFKKQIQEVYHPLKEIEIKSIEKALKEAKNKLIALKNKTVKDDRHPYLEQNKIDEFIPKIESIIGDFKNFECMWSNESGQTRVKREEMALAT